MERKYRYVGYIMILFLPLIFAAFYKSYFEHFPIFSSRIHWFDHVHAIIASAWMLTLIIQPVLASRKKFELHRKIGRLTYFIFPLLILSFIPREIRLIVSDEPKDLFFPLADSLVLIPLYLLAIYNKKNTAKHMRYMIASALVFFGPTIGRIGPKLLGLSGIVTQNVQYTVIYSILIGLILYDNINFKKSQPYLVAIALFFLHQMTFYFLFL
jgi:hypothetical protein